MIKDIKIYGSLLQAYVICPRQAWLLSRNIRGNQYNEFLEIGRLISETTYKRDKKEIFFGNNKLDVIRDSDNCITVIEVKKSSKMIEASKIQLLNYMYLLSKKGYRVKGEIRVPREKRVVPVELGDAEKELIENIKKDVISLVYKKDAPSPKWIGACKSCSYNEFCWS